MSEERIQRRLVRSLVMALLMMMVVVELVRALDNKTVLNSIPEVWLT